jgi:hypothetical protein
MGTNLAKDYSYRKHLSIYNRKKKAGPAGASLI